MVILSLSSRGDFQGMIALDLWNLKFRAMFAVLICEVLALPEVSLNKFDKVRKFIASFSSDFNAYL